MSRTVSKTEAVQQDIDSARTNLPAAPIPYLPIERHAVIGDRQSAALVAADGTIDWLCLPHYGGDVVLGAILDCDRGGFWRLGPAARLTGTQRYRGDTVTLLTTWETRDFTLELVDTMSPPYQSNSGEREPSSNGRFLVRQLRCLRGRAECAIDLRLCNNFAPIPVEFSDPQHASAHAPQWHVGLWTSWPLAGGESHGRIADDTVGRFALSEGHEVWAVL